MGNSFRKHQPSEITIGLMQYPRSTGPKSPGRDQQRTFEPTSSTVS